ncbi:MAG TPA: response regulator transcription factor [Candidatus Paceibacterota bacterium]|nr:response regulator transcription factor [Candidatus Paceibacterota bacterium]
MRNAHILIIEDHSTLLPYIEKSLQKEGFLVTSISNQQNASSHLSDTKLSLIILDRILPNASGTALVHTLAQQQPQTPILVLSDAPEKLTRDELKKLRLENFLIKPFAFQDFLSMTRDILEKHAGLGDELVLDNLIVDTKNKLVKRGGKTIILTKKEHVLLTYLMKHRDHAVPRADLLENVWGMQIDPLSNTIEAHILSLRHKIDSAGQTKLIHTVPKFGYRMSINK